MKKYSKILSAGMLCLVFSQAHPKDVSFPQCPQELPIRQVVRTAPADGWEIIGDTDTQQLRSIGISFEEYPTIQTGLDIPDEEKLPSGDVIAHYYADAAGGGHDYWAVCGYSNSDVVLVQQLPQNIVRCEVKYQHNQVAPNKVTIKCFDTPREAE